MSLPCPYDLRRFSRVEPSNLLLVFAYVCRPPPHTHPTDTQLAQATPVLLQAKTAASVGPSLHRCVDQPG